MPVSIATTIGLLAVDAPAHRVYTRANWVEPWVWRPHLFATWCQFDCSPNLPRAELVYDFGQLLRPGTVVFQAVPPLDVTGHFAKIEISQPDDSEGDPSPPICWYGRVAEVATDRMGILTDTIGGQPLQTPTGTQRFDCIGLEKELDRLYLASSVIEGPGEPRIGRAIAVNRGGGNPAGSDLDVLPNRSEAIGEKNTFLFAERLAGARLWQADELLDYVLAYHTPGDIPWSVDPDGQLGFLRWYQPSLELHGLSVRQVLDALVDRRRLSAWTARVFEQEGDVDQVKIYVFSLTPNAIASSLGNQILPANPYQKSLDFDHAFDVHSAVLVQSKTHVVDQVRTVGARRTTTFTVHGGDGSLTRDWTDGEQLAYRLGGSTLDEYAAADVSDQERLNDVVRAEAAVRRAWSYFVISPDWDSRVTDPLDSGAPPRPANPALDSDGDPQANVVSPFWYPGIRLVHNLGLKADYDYSRGEVIAPDPLPGTPPEAIAAPMAPFAVVRFEKGETEHEVVRLDLVAAQSRDELLGDGGRDWSGTLQMRDNAPGFTVEIAPPNRHKLAKEHFVPLDDVEEIEPEADYATDLFVTVCWQTDDYCEVIWPAEPDPAIVFPREERIELGDDYRLDYLAPYAIVGVENGQARQAASGGFVRDDRERMRALAQVAFEWYSRERQAFSLTFGQVGGGFVVGDMLIQVGSGAHVETVNSAVTSVRYDLLGVTTAIATDFGDLDLQSFSQRSAERAS